MLWRDLGLCTRVRLGLAPRRSLWYPCIVRLGVLAYHFVGACRPDTAARELATSHVDVANERAQRSHLVVLQSDGFRLQLQRPTQRVDGGVVRCDCPVADAALKIRHEKVSLSRWSVAPCVRLRVRLKRSNCGSLRVESAAEASDRLALRVDCPMENADLYQQVFTLREIARAVSPSGPSGGVATMSPQTARTRSHSTDCAADTTTRAVPRAVTSGRAPRPPLLPQPLKDAHLSAPPSNRRGRRRPHAFEPAPDDFQAHLESERRVPTRCGESLRCCPLWTSWRRGSR